MKLLYTRVYTVFILTSTHFNDSLLLLMLSNRMHNRNQVPGRPTPETVSKHPDYLRICAPIQEKNREGLRETRSTGPRVRL